MNWLIAAISILVGISATSSTGASEDGLRLSRSIGYVRETITSQTDAQLDKAPASQFPQMIREGYRRETALIPSPRHAGCDCDLRNFRIADAWISLQTDTDFDGYYRRFKLNLDVDVDSGSAWVYADIYLSFEGGPWNRLFTTVNFNIVDNSRLDEYVVETELDSGYPAGYYDILIELYHADSTHFLLDYGPYDSSDLSALPLEDRQRDLIGGNSYSYGLYGGGSFGLISLLLLASLRQLKYSPSTRRDSSIVPSGTMPLALDCVYNDAYDKPADAAILREYIYYY